MTRLSLGILTLVFASFGSFTASAAIAEFTFDTDAEGWTGIGCTQPNVVCAAGAAGSAVTFSHLATGGNPGGYIATTDPGDNDAARMVAPGSLLPLLGQGQTISFDVLLDPNGGPGSVDPSITVLPLLTIEGGGLTLIYTEPLANLPAINDWTTFTAPLDPGAGWVLFDGTLTPPAATQGNFDTVFGGAGPTRLTVIGEWLSEGAEIEQGGLDNFIVTPVPAALPLLSLACAALFSATRRRGSISR